MNKTKPYNKEMFQSFFELVNKGVLSEEELNTYVETFTKYLNAKVEEPEPIPLTKKTQMETGPSPWSSVWSYFTIMLIHLGLLGLIAWMIIAGRQDNMVIAVIGCVIVGAGFLLSSIITGYNTVKLYAHRRNTRLLQVGEVYSIDPTASLMFSDKLPTTVQLLSITDKILYCLDLETRKIHKLSIYRANLLIKTANDTAVFLRYPSNLPDFTANDCKVLEAAMIIAKANNEEKIYHHLGDLLGKARFYNNNPYGEHNKAMNDVVSMMQRNIDDVRGEMDDEDK